MADIEIPKCEDNSLKDDPLILITIEFSLKEGHKFGMSIRAKFSDFEQIRERLFDGYYEGHDTTGCIRMTGSNASSHDSFLIPKSSIVMISITIDPRPKQSEPHPEIEGDMLWTNLKRKVCSALNRLFPLIL